MKKLYYLLMMLLAVSFTACEDDGGLPKPTQNGSEMMAARINGKAWQREACWGCLGGGSGLSVSYSNDGFLWITGQENNDRHHYTVRLVIKGVDRIGDYALKEKASGNYGEVNDYSERGNEKFYMTTANSTGKVTITKLDTQNKIISGTFSFRAPNENNPSEYVEVTDGWFDVKY